MQNDNVLKYMYRYLERFTGTYRVLPEFIDDIPRDEDGSIDESFEDLYIPCKKGVIKHTYIDNDILAICFYDKPILAKNTFAELKKKYPNIDLKLDVEWKDSNGKKVVNNDGFIYFNSNDIKKVATIIKPKTSGASIKWNSTRNLPKAAYEIPKSDLDKFTSITKDMDKSTKMHFVRSCCSDYLVSISTKRKDMKQEFKESRLKPKEFIHSIGKWGDFIKYVEKRAKEV